MKSLTKKIEEFLSKSRNPKTRAEILEACKVEDGVSSRLFFLCEKGKVKRRKKNGRNIYSAVKTA